MSSLPSEARQNKGPAFLTVALFFTALASIFVLLRLHVRLFLRKAFGWDDGVIVLATILAIVSTGFNVPEVIAGYGKHLYVLSRGDIIEALKWNYLATPLLVFSLAASKSSICLFLLRILEKTRTRFKRSFPYGIILLLLLIAIPSAGYSLGQCQPVRKLWNPTTPGHCQDPRIYVKLGYANGAINAFGDFALAVFPLSFIKNLQLERRKKIVLASMMCCGIVCGALAITRTILTGDLTAQSDITYDSVDSALIALIEENVSIIVACVPTLGPLFRKFSDRTQSLKPLRRSIGRRHPSQTVEQKPPSLPLHHVATPPFTGISNLCTVTVAKNSHIEDSLSTNESEINLVSGIHKTVMYGVTDH